MAGDNILREMSRSKLLVCCVLEAIQMVLITDCIHEAHLEAPQ